MSSENIDDMPPHKRFEAFMKTWNELKATGDFVASQEEADRIAALYKTTAPRVTAQAPAPSGDGGKFVAIPDRYTGFRGKGGYRGS